MYVDEYRNGYNWTLGTLDRDELVRCSHLKSADGLGFPSISIVRCRSEDSFTSNVFGGSFLNSGPPVGNEHSDCNITLICI